MEKNNAYLLVVEDIPDILALLDTTLKFKGYRVVTARNGRRAYGSDDLPVANFGHSFRA